MPTCCSQKLQIILDAIPAIIDISECRRIFHGRGHCFYGLEHIGIDYFPPLVFIMLYQEEDPEFLRQLAQTLMQRIPGAESVMVQRRYSTSPSEILCGNPPARILARENNLLFQIAPERNRNIGFFPDMRSGRKLIQEKSEGLRVLNLFAYTCSFSVAACAGGAASVVNLDMNKRALQEGRVNHQLNGFSRNKVSYLAHDLFKSFSKLRRFGPFDLVIIDPPTRQGKSFKAEKDWGRIIRRLPELCTASSEILACLNAPGLPTTFLAEQFSKNWPDAEHIFDLLHLVDFPEKFQNKSLKISLFKAS